MPARRALQVAGIMLIFAGAGLAAHKAKPQDTTAEPTPAEASAGENEPSEQTAEEEAPFQASANAKPSLDYEPTESISEDRSVSFPVDI